MGTAEGRVVLSIFAPMPVTLSAIQFNHDPASKRSSGLNLRKNVREFVELPEWRRGVTRRPEESVAAYAISETRGSVVRIRASFAAEAGIRTCEVRAIELPRPDLPWWTSYIHPPDVFWPVPGYFRDYDDYLRFLAYSNTYQFWQMWLTARSNLLGEVRPRVVELTNGETGLVDLELQNVRISSRGVGVHEVAWLWQYRLRPGEPWRDIDVTRHRIYTTLALPTAPWTQEPYEPGNTLLPWTDALDEACAWASGVTNIDAAARLLTHSLYRLGGTVIEYGCPPFEAYSNTFFSVFHCTAFLDRLRGGPGNGRFVNCSDCATILSTFTNLLGGDLWQSRMGRYVPAFDTNPILAIGSNRWQTPCGLGVGFVFHEVAWKGECASNDAVFDASLAVDADLFPFGAPQIPLLAANLRFGLPGDGQYRDRLAAPSDRQLCAPRPEERRRRIPV